jgi:hypothetical protein
MTIAPTMTIDIAKAVLRVGFTPNLLSRRSANPLALFWFRIGEAVLVVVAKRRNEQGLELSRQPE